MAEPDFAPSEHERFMGAAIRLSRRELGRTWPNPAVGCLIVAGREGERMVAGHGWTMREGRPHAETVALAEAGEAARGATAYVSLEPCAHHGKTPPCGDALIQAGIKRVVAPLEDPDPRVAGRGFALLQSAGVEVIVGPLAEAARAVNRGHFMRVKNKRPWATLKLAVSRDGRIAGAGRTPVAITGQLARENSHMLRATHDAILVGIGTVLADDPELTCRLPGMEDRSPVRVVLDSHLRLPPGARLFESTEVAPVWVMTTEQADEGRRRQLEGKGALVLTVPGQGRQVDIAAALSVLADRGLTRLLVEGGAAVAGSMMKHDLVDEAVIFQSGVVIGPEGLAAIPEPGLAVLTEGGAYRRTGQHSVGDDMMTSYLRAR